MDAIKPEARECIEIRRKMGLVAAILFARANSLPLTATMYRRQWAVQKRREQIRVVV